MRFGTAGIPRCVNGSTLEGIRGIADLSLSAMEVQFVHGIQMKAPLAFEAGKLAKELGVALSVHAPYYINLLGSKEVVAKSQERILGSCRMASIMAASPVVVHAGFGSNTKGIIDALTPVVSRVREESLNVKVGLETMGRQKQWGSLDEVLEVCSVLDVVPVVDFSHLHARSSGGLKTTEDYVGIFEKIEASNASLLKNLHCHFSGIEYKNGSEVRHLPLDDSPPFEPLARLLVDLGLELTLISESPLLEVDAIKMKETVNKIRGL